MSFGAGRRLAPGGVHRSAHVATDTDAGELDEGGAAKIVGESEVGVRARDDGAELLLVETRAIDR